MPEIGLDACQFLLLQLFLWMCYLNGGINEQNCAKFSFNEINNSWAFYSFIYVLCVRLVFTYWPTKQHYFVFLRAEMTDGV